jgi:hypothetical protein
VTREIIAGIVGWPQFRPNQNAGCVENYGKIVMQLLTMVNNGRMQYNLRSRVMYRVRKEVNQVFRFTIVIVMMVGVMIMMTGGLSIGVMMMMGRGTVCQRKRIGNACQEYGETLDQHRPKLNAWMLYS